MGSQRTRGQGESSLRETLVQYLLVALFGTLIVAGFVHEAVEAAARFGWIAYPLVLGTGVASFALARYAWRVVSDGLEAELCRQQLEEETVRANGNAVSGETQ